MRTPPVAPLRAGLAACGVGAALRRQLGRERLYRPISISTRSPPPAPSALPALIARGASLFKAKFTTDDGAGRPKATQAIVPTKRKFGVNPAFTRTSGPDSNSCFGCHNDPDRRRHRRLRHQCVRFRGIRERAIRFDRSLVLERAPYRRR